MLPIKFRRQWADITTETFIHNLTHDTYRKKPDDIDEENVKQIV